MTPFGQKIRELRTAKGISQAAMAKALHVSPAYLSALERGKRGKPSWGLVQSIIAFFDIIWDEAEELQNLAKLSHPKITVDTSGLSANATKLANLISRDVAKLSEQQIDRMLKILSEKTTK